MPVPTANLAMRFLPGINLTTRSPPLCPIFFGSSRNFCLCCGAAISPQSEAERLAPRAAAGHRRADGPLFSGWAIVLDLTNVKSPSTAMRDRLALRKVHGKPLCIAYL
jgi:hypothetical protein